MPSIEKNRITQVDVSEKDIASLLKPLIKGTNSKLIIECLTTLLSECTPYQNSAFVKAYLGIEPDLKYKAGDEVLIKCTHLSDWNWDLEAMNLNDYFIFAPDGTKFIKGTIYGFKRYSENPYLLEYKYIKQDEINIARAGLSHLSITHAEEYAELFPSLPEDKKEQ